MGTLVYYDYCALVLLIILLVSTVCRRMTKGKLNQIFILMLTVIILATAADIWAITLDNLGTGHGIQREMAHTLYLEFHNLTSPIYLLYIITLTDTWHKFEKALILKLGLVVPISIVTLLLLQNPIFHNVYYFDEYGTYTRGQLFPVLYVCAALYVLFGVWYLIRYAKLINRWRFVSLISLFPLMGISILIQYLFPGAPIEMFVNAIGLLFISMMVQRPEERINVVTGLGKLSAYIDDMKRCFKNEKPVEIVMMNITNFSSIRDILDYETVNYILRLLANRLVHLNRRMNTEAELYYLGDGKFRYVLDQKHFHQTRQIAETVNSTMKTDFQLKQMEINLRTCVCIMRSPEDIKDIDALLAFGNDLNARPYTGEILLASSIFRQNQYDVLGHLDYIIEDALVSHKFEVYYQPIYSIHEKRFNSAEALLRLKDETYGFISPEYFIPAAERSGAIHRIGEYVLEEVCRFVSSDTFAKLNLDYIEVNLSVVQCMQRTLADSVLNMLRKYHVPSEKINLEITETAVSSSQNTMMDNLSQLYEAGIRFSLDDFGTGYSNMRRIASLPLHIVKLDKTFATAETNDNMTIVLENTIKMIKAMNMQIVVEGIETLDLVKRFTALDCEYIQGYYYSKPIPKKDFITFIQNANETIAET